jgi:hypothetical protein
MFLLAIFSENHLQQSKAAYVIFKCSFSHSHIDEHAPKFIDESVELQRCLFDKPAKEEIMPIHYDHFASRPFHPIAILPNHHFTY